MTALLLETGRRRPRCPRYDGFLQPETYGGQQLRRCANCGHSPDAPAPKQETRSALKARVELSGITVAWPLQLVLFDLEGCCDPQPSRSHRRRRGQRRMAGLQLSLYLPKVTGWC